MPKTDERHPHTVSVLAGAHLNNIDEPVHTVSNGQTFLLYTGQQLVDAFVAGFEAHLRTPATDTETMRIVQKHYAHIASLDREAMTEAEREQTRGAWNAISAVKHEIERLSATDTEAMRQIAADLIDQRDEPDMFGLSYDRVHYWRDKAINAAARIDALAKGGVS